MNEVQTVKAIDWRRTPGSHQLSDKQIAQMPDLLRDLGDAVEILAHRAALMELVEDICFVSIDEEQICGVRRAAHHDYMPDHVWTSWFGLTRYGARATCTQRVNEK